MPARKTIPIRLKRNKAICHWIRGVGVCALLLGVACNKQRGSPAEKPLEPYVADSGSVGFDIAPLPSRGDEVGWLATHTSGGRIAKFQVWIGSQKSSNVKDFSLKTGSGKFVAVDGSDSTALLAELKKALEAKKDPQNNVRKAELPFSFANLGDNLSQASGGGFDSKPAGHWTAMKIFIGDGDDECEVFLNINPLIRKAQFSIKDADYGDQVLNELSKVL